MITIKVRGPFNLRKAVKIEIGTNAVYEMTVSGTIILTFRSAELANKFFVWKIFFSPNGKDFIEDPDTARYNKTTVLLRWRGDIRDLIKFIDRIDPTCRIETR